MTCAIDARLTERINEILAASTLSEISAGHSMRFAMDAVSLTVATDLGGQPEDAVALEISARD